MTDKIQLYSLATPNGQKASIALEEMQLPYEATRIDIMKGDQFADDFIKINPNSKIPAIVDPNGPDGKPISIMESGAILIYLAEKSGKFLPQDAVKKNEVIQWLFFQMASVGPMFGQFGHFYKYAGDKCQDPYPTVRYKTEVKRLMSVMEKRLEGRDFICDEYSIADMAIVPWIGCLDWGYSARDFLDVDSFKNVVSWHDRVMARPAAERGSKVCPF